jgi:hypothetical protein
METLIWIGILLVVAIVVWRAAPYHERIIANRDIPRPDTSD